VDRPEIRAYVQRARAHAGLTRRGRRKPNDVITVVKTKTPRPRKLQART
jgi:hypothetical protein